MSLLDDYEELCNTQDISIFKDALDETLKPILIIMDERYFKLNMMLNELKDKINDLKDSVEFDIKGLDAKFNHELHHELNDAYATHNTKLNNIWSDVLKLQKDIEAIKLNLKKR